MSTSTSPATFTELYTDLMNRVRVDTTQSATAMQAKRYLNIALQDLHLGFGEKMPWCHREATLAMLPPYSTGTVAIAKGATSLVGTGTAWATTGSFGVANVRAGYGRLTVNGNIEPLEIATVGGDTAITLAQRFVHDDVTAGSFAYFQDEYDLASDFLRPLDVRSFDLSGEIELMGRAMFRRLYPRNTTTRKPAAACIVDRAPSGNTTPIRRIVFHPPPDAAYLIPYGYITGNLATTAAGVAQAGLVNDTDEPIVPLRYRHALVYHALEAWYRDKKNDARSAEAKAAYTDIMLRITSDAEIGAPRPQLSPRVSHYARSARTPYRRRGGRGRYATGTAFDEMR